MARTLGIPLAQADHFVLHGRIVNNAYDDTRQRIELLYKDGGLRDIEAARDHFGIPAMARPVETWESASHRRRGWAGAGREGQEAADAMRRGGTGAAGQGNAALDRLRNAARSEEGVRQRSVTDDIRQLDDKARQLEAQQERIASGVERLGAAAPSDRAQQLRRLDQQKDSLSRGLEQVREEAERLARDAVSYTHLTPPTTDPG